MNRDFEPYPVLETERLILNEITDDHVEELSAVLSDPDVAKYDYFYPTKSIEEVMQFIERYGEERQDNEEITWGIFEKHSKKLVGTCGIGNFSDPAKRGEVGYAIAQEHWGKGYAAESIGAVVTYGFEVVGLNRIEGNITPGNQPSERVLEKNGFTREGHVRQRDWMKGQLVDSIVMGLLKSDFEARKTQRLSHFQDPSLKEKILSLEKSLKETDFSGRFQIQKGDELIFDHVKGFADRSEGRLSNKETLYGTASGTKFLTALGIGKLLEAKFLSLDTPASEVLNLEIESYDPKITIRQLLSHTSGMPDYLDEDLFEDVDNIELAIPNYKLVSPKDYLPLFPRIPMIFEPGSQFAYNNGAFVYLAMIIETLSGMSYKDYINHELLEPIGITRSGVFATNDLPSNAALGYVLEEDRWVSNIFKLPIQAGGDGGAWINAADMLTLWQAFDSAQIVSEDMKNEFIKSHAVVEADRGIEYGLGLWLKKTEKGYEPFVVGSDAGVSFKSSYNLSTKGYRFAVSNTTEGVWDVIDEFNAIQI